MKKLISLLLAALLLLGCASAFAEAEAPAITGTLITDDKGDFPVSFILPENAKLVSSQWAGSNQYQANISTTDGLWFYFSIAKPQIDDSEVDEEVSTEPVTYNEANGYTDEVVKEELRNLYSDDSDDFDVDVMSTAYGTKLAIVRFNDKEAPSAYMYTCYKGYEIGLTVIALDPQGNAKPITEEHLQRVVDFASEIWMGEEAFQAAEE